MTATDSSSRVAVSPQVTARAQAITERELARYAERTTGSQAATERARKVLPLGVPSSFQAYDPHPDNLEAAWVMVSSTPDDPAARGGLFGPRLPVPADAPLLDRVLAGAGRDPQWGASTWRWRVHPEDELEKAFRRSASRARG